MDQWILLFKMGLPALVALLGAVVILFIVKELMHRVNEWEHRKLYEARQPECFGSGQVLSRLVYIANDCEHCAHENPCRASSSTC